MRFALILLSLFVAVNTAKASVLVMPASYSSASTDAEYFDVLKAQQDAAASLSMIGPTSVMLPLISSGIIEVDRASYEAALGADSAEYALSISASSSKSVHFANYPSMLLKDFALAAKSRYAILSRVSSSCADQYRLSLFATPLRKTRELVFGRAMEKYDKYMRTLIGGTVGAAVGGVGGAAAGAFMGYVSVSRESTYRYCTYQIKSYLKDVLTGKVLSSIEAVASTSDSSQNALFTAFRDSYSRLLSQKKQKEFSVLYSTYTSQGSTKSASGAPPEEPTTGFNIQHCERTGFNLK